MGHNTVLYIDNDALEEITRDLPGWWERVKIAIKANATSSHDQIGAGSHWNCTQVVSVAHADFTQVVAVGGNYATCLAVLRGDSHHTEEDKVRIASEWALSLAEPYTLAKTSSLTPPQAALSLVKPRTRITMVPGVPYLPPPPASPKAKASPTSKAGKKKPKAAAKSRLKPNQEKKKAVKGGRSPRTKKVTKNK